MDAGADAIGLNFYSPSVRSVSIEQACNLTAAVRQRETVWNGQIVGVFVNHTAEQIAETVKATELDIVQLHGDERPAFIADIRSALKRESLDVDIPVIRAVRIAKDLGGEAAVADLNQEVFSWKAAGAAMVLLDAAVPGSFGGTGARLDWNALSGVSLALPFALAGGLNPENIAEAISIATPDAVDVASGVENDQHRKDADSMSRFVAQALTAFGRTG